MFRLGLLVGMRPGELAGLRLGDIDFARGILTVGHTVQMNGSRGIHVDVLKTTASHRTVSGTGTHRMGSGSARRAIGRAFADAAAADDVASTPAPSTCAQGPS